MKITAIILVALLASFAGWFGYTVANTVRIRLEVSKLVADLVVNSPPGFASSANSTPQTGQKVFVEQIIAKEITPKLLSLPHRESSALRLSLSRVLSIYTDAESGKPFNHEGRETWGSEAKRYACQQCIDYMNE
jgi:hypothetical protein